ncbi:oligopeptidase A [Alteromonas stellipolaris]|uniref:oligopeptidase A n=1 Tax=Alteromonas stellipolaris TaxID=233316 RepID=A0AAW7Z4C5_9ALTE|nr:oligopeptidase A [Alteromonas stellipolaris]MDO6536094.1 oligopeptidase A [Alteromonas stellipolaris]MDO6540015.1 oligopeptidase A [Alteromonas stellipolaris]MDO6578767.1 oligopeptidase A [Alteromonas stellipolaris]MDO6628002.1 oligopeptidase A [Alteromonas stellipolaris]MDP2536397.1 oligopeptidase A [Alteromonas stellipolaris]
MTTPAIELVDGLPLFSSIKPAQIKPAIEKAIAKCKLEIDEVVASKDYSYANLVLRLEEVDDNLSKMWSPVSHMNSVVSSDELREAHDACLPLLSEYGTWVGQHEGLYNAYVAIKDSNEYADLDEQRQKVIDNAIRDFTLSGVALPSEEKKRYADIQAKLSELSSTFSNNVMDATMGWSKHVTDEAILSGMPESARDAAAQAAHQKDLQGWLFTLDIPSYLPVMLYADNAELREEMYRAYATKASDQGPNAGKWDNTDIIQQTLALRSEIAQLLGFGSYSERSLATKMAESTDQVTGFLRDLAAKSKPQAERELEEVRAYAKDTHGVTELNAWDLPYYSEKLKQEKYTISDEMLRPYFPEDKVLSGLFEVVHRLYGLKIIEQPGIDTWHKDVRYFTITDSADALRGSFYLDLYARAKKRGGAWMDECRVRREKLDGELQLPVAYLTCNFNAPIGDKPALFTHDEVVTLFHEFGHGIHHMLTKMSVAGVSGINGVPWDAVELPSQFLENWCWEEDALNFISGHFETGEPLPADLLDRMLAARDYQAAMQMVRQLEFSLFDFLLHSESGDNVDVQAILNSVRAEVAVNTPPAFNRFQHSFGHIFAGGYAAGYYSYKWAEVLSADAYSKFEEDGIFNQETGKAFLENILEMGGSRAPMDLFVAFRGREPNVDALLRHSGIRG